MTIEQFIEYNFRPIIGLVFQVMILSFSKGFSKVERRFFAITLILEVLEVSSYNLEFHFSEFSTPSVRRVFFSAAGYVMRPALYLSFKARD